MGPLAALISRIVRCAVTVDGRGVAAVIWVEDLVVADGILGVRGCVNCCLIVGSRQLDTMENPPTDILASSVIYGARGARVLASTHSRVDPTGPTRVLHLDESSG